MCSFDLHVVHGHAPSENIFEWEDRSEATPFRQHAVAGSCAGVMEHVVMYPLDTIKTRMQVCGKFGAWTTLKIIVRERGVVGLMRGSVVIGVGCIPAHVGLFGTYEFARTRLLDTRLHQPFQTACCGALASTIHDAIMTPADVVKQRLQLGCHTGAVDCAVSVWRREGLVAFYRSLPTTLMMNIPYNGMLIAANESLKRFLSLKNYDEGATFADAPWYFVSAGSSGAFAAAMTLPLDVVKTRLQTQPGGDAIGRGRPRYSGIVSTMGAIHADEGWRGFYRGLGPRVALAMPAAAVCWGTYETVRMSLSNIGFAF